MKKLIVALLLVISGGVGVWQFAVNANPIVAEVGQLTIRQRDVLYREELDKLEGRPSSNAFEHLVRDFRTVEVARAAGVPVTETILNAEEARVNRLSRPGTPMARVQKTFGSDRDSFRRVYLAPMLAERKLQHEYFPTKSPAQAEARAKAEATLAAIKRDPKQAKQIASASGLKWEPVTFSRDTGVVWGESHKTESPQIHRHLASDRRLHSSLGEFWVQRFQNDKPGDVHPVLEEWAGYWLALRLVSIDKKFETYHAEALKFSQAEFVRWFQAESQKVSFRRL